MLGAALRSPTELFAVWQGTQVVHGHHLSRQSQLPLSGGSGNESPDTRRAAGSEHREGASVTSSGLSHALDLVQRACGEVADVQDLDGGSGGPTKVLRLPARRARRYRWGKTSGVRQATRVHGQPPTETRQLGHRGGTGVTGRADAGVGQSTPGAAISGGVRKAGTDVPTVVGGYRRRGQLLRMQADGTLPDSLIPLDWIAAFTAAVALGTAQKSARAVGIDTQRASRVGRDRPAVPAPGYR